MAEETRCWSCQAPIVFAVLGSGPGSMPVDAGSADDPKGNLAVRRDGEGILTARVMGKDRTLRPGEHYGTAHWSTCEHAAWHRKRS